MLSPLRHPCTPTCTKLLRTNRKTKHQQIPKSGFQVTLEKPKPKQLLRLITTGEHSAMSQSQFLANTCNSLDARENSRVHGANGFDFAYHRLKSWGESLKPITKRSNRNHVITFDSHLKIALIKINYKNLLN